MMELSTQLHILAQGHNLDQWGDLLVVAVMAFLWLAGGLAKVIASKKGARQGRQRETQAKQPAGRRETWQERLARKAQEIQRAAEAKARQLEQAVQSGTQGRTAHKKRVSPQPPAGKIRIRHGPTGESVMVYERPPDRPPVRRRPDASQAVARAGQQVAKPREIQSPTPDPLAVTPQQPPVLQADSAASPAQPAGLQPAEIIDYTDPDALKKAVLHYEILGRPLALREPSEGDSMF